MKTYNSTNSVSIKIEGDENLYDYDINLNRKFPDNIIYPISPKKLGPKLKTW